MKKLVGIAIFAIFGTIVASTEVGYGVSLIYPERGQSQAQQTQDLHECNEQAREETDFNPAKPISQDEPQSPQSQRQRQERIQAYNEILTTCLKERGYSIQG
jgi:arylamine N-acetyltransferase